jgi:hypothetical protein
MMMHANMMMEGPSAAGKNRSSFEIAQAAIAAKLGAKAVTGVKADQPQPLVKGNKGQGTGVPNKPVLQRNAAEGSAPASKADSASKHQNTGRPLPQPPQQKAGQNTPPARPSTPPPSTPPIPKKSTQEQVKAKKTTSNKEEPLSPTFLKTLSTKFSTQKEKLFNAIADLTVVQLLKDGLAHAKQTEGGPKAQLKALVKSLKTDLDKNIDSALQYVQNNVPNIGIKALKQKVKDKISNLLDNVMRTILKAPVFKSVRGAGMNNGGPTAQLFQMTNNTTDVNAGEVINEVENKVDEIDILIGSMSLGNKLKEGTSADEGNATNDAKTNATNEQPPARPTTPPPSTYPDGTSPDGTIPKPPPIPPTSGKKPVGQSAAPGGGRADLNKQIEGANFKFTTDEAKKARDQKIADKEAQRKANQKPAAGPASGEQVMNSVKTELDKRQQQISSESTNPITNDDAEEWDTPADEGKQ